MKLSLKRRVMVDAKFAATAIGCDAMELLNLIDSRKIRWAWDISRNQDCRMCIRIDSGSLADYLNGQPQLNPNNSEHWLKVMNALLPLSSPGWTQNFIMQHVTAYELSRILNVDPQHTINLWKKGFIQTVPGSKAFPGPGGSPKIMRSSVIEFLQNRRLI